MGLTIRWSPPRANPAFRVSTTPSVDSTRDAAAAYALNPVTGSTEEEERVPRTAATRYLLTTTSRRRRTVPSTADTGGFGVEATAFGGGRRGILAQTRRIEAVDVKRVGLRAGQ